MNKRKHSFDGLSIHGHKLKVYFKGDGLLSSSFVIERSDNSSWLLVFFVPCFLAVVVALHKDLLSLTTTNCLVWAAVLFTAVGLKLCYFNVLRETVLIVKDLGIQFTRSGPFGLQTSHFIEQHRIVDVLINEVITMHQVVFYLTLLITDGPGDSTWGKNQQLLPLFTSSTPRLETIKPIYHGMQQILGTTKNW